MKQVTIVSTWSSSTMIEVADDWQPPNPGALDLGVDAHGNGIAEQIQVDAATADLVDWEVVR